MSPERPFPFHRNGNANRRDPEAVPRVLLLGVEDGRASIHVAGESCQRAVTLGHLGLDLITGMAPADAYRLGYATAGLNHE